MHRCIREERGFTPAAARRITRNLRITNEKVLIDELTLDGGNGNSTGAELRSLYPLLAEMEQDMEITASATDKHTWRETYSTPRIRISGWCSKPAGIERFYSAHMHGILHNDYAVKCALHHQDMAGPGSVAAGMHATGYLSRLEVSSEEIYVGLVLTPTATYGVQWFDADEHGLWSVSSDKNGRFALPEDIVFDTDMCDKFAQR